THTAKPKAPSRTLERKHTSPAFTQTRACQPRTKQSTISAFFSARAGEKDKENSKPSPFILTRDCTERGVSLAASPVKILALPQTRKAQKESLRAETAQATAQRPAQKAPASPTPSPDPSVVQAESHSKSEASCGAGEDCCFFTQDSEGNWIIAHRNESDAFARETVSASGSRPGRAQPLRECSQNAAAAEEGRGCRSGLSSPCRHLFTQDSQGNRVIAHRYQGVPSPRRELPDSPHKGCASGAANSLSKRGEPWVDVGYESLFTQDSEGNRVIKHGYMTLSGSPSDLEWVTP
ncbi:PREDICTED: aurora kinase A and ninein-interacting protein, partial [Eurypyga helias]|uniref:aurora kinase A and ninein-interacting protein n=1 Tax=Eurypyga helias TaxID=54383 RepID=UPI000528C25E